MCDPISATLAVATVGSSMMTASAQKSAANADAKQQEFQGSANKAIAYSNADATEKAAQYSASVNEENALIYEAAALDSLQRGVDAAAGERQEARKVIGRGRAAIGSSGTRADTGSNLDLIVENAGIGEGNALSIVNNAEREGRGYKQQANEERNQGQGTIYNAKLEADSLRFAGDTGATMSNYAAANTRYAGKLNAQSTIISGITNAASQGYNTFSAK